VREDTSGTGLAASAAFGRFAGGHGLLRALAELEPLPDGGTRLTYQVWAHPARLLGRILIPVEIGRKFGRGLERVLLEYDAQTEATPPPSLRRAEPARDRIDTRRRQLAQASPELVQKLVDFLEQGDDLALSRIRPYALAARWGAPRRVVLELCLQATRAGLLDSRWEVLCTPSAGPSLPRAASAASRALPGVAAARASKIG
jgi:hypothetical protein